MKTPLVKTPLWKLERAYWEIAKNVKGGDAIWSYVNRLADDLNKSEHENTLLKEKIARLKGDIQDLLDS